jgi:hypothetical protein
MSLRIKDLVQKNKAAYDKHFYIESVNLSYILIVAALRSIIKGEKLNLKAQPKLSECIKVMKSHYTKAPLFKNKLKKSAFKNIMDFNADYKEVMKAIRYQYPDVKLKTAAKKGIHNIVMLNTTLIKLRSNIN